MFSNVKLDDLSVDIFSRALFTKVDKDDSSRLEFDEIKIILNDLYGSFGEKIEVDDSVVRNFLRSNGIYENTVDLDHFKKLLNKYIGINNNNDQGYDLIKKDRDVMNLTLKLN